MKKQVQKTSRKETSAASEKNDAGSKKNQKKAAPVVAEKKKINSIINLVLSFIIAMALSGGKDKNGESGKDPRTGKVLRKFSKKEKEELLSRVKKQIKNVQTVSATNLYKVNLGFLKLGRAEFLDYINNMIILMAASAAYPTPAPALDDITDLIDLEAATRAEKDYINANIYLRQLKNMIRELCVYIANTCDNDVVVLRSVGVRENKSGPGPSVEAPQARIKVVKDTKKSGEAKVTVWDEAGMMGIGGRWKSADAIDAKWESGYFALGVNLIFTGMPKGSSVILQVRFKSGKGYGDWSDEKTYIVR